MTSVQLSGQVPGEELNGLPPLQDYFLRADSDPVIAIVVIDTAKDVNNRVSGEKYPVVRFTRIEPVLDEGDAAAAREILTRAYNARENKEPLDLGDVEEEAPTPIASGRKKKTGGEAES